MNERASRSAYVSSNVWDAQFHKNRIVRIYQPQRPHVHSVPYNKEVGKYWAIEFESWGTYKSPLMGWTSGTQDSMSKLLYKTPTLSSAVKYAKQMGWGYDIQYPRNRWHTKKSYSDNFIWKG